MSLRSIKKRTDWEQMGKEVEALITRLRKKPKKSGYGLYDHPLSILMGYQEGDINHNEAIKALEKWKDEEVKNALSAREDPLVHAESQRDMRLRMGF